MGLLDMIQNDPEKREALRMGLLSAGINMLAGGRQDFGTSLGMGFGAGVDMYQGQLAEQKKKRAQQNIMAALTPPAPQYVVSGTPYGTRAEAAEAQKRAMGYKVADKRFTDPHEAFRYKETMYRQAPTDSNPDIPVMEDMPDIEERTTPYDQRWALLQAMLQNPDAGYQDVALKAMLEQQKADKTAEMKNWEYGMGLPEDQRQQFFARAGAGSSPSSVQEWEFFNRLDPQQQARYLEMKRNPQIMNLGGEMAVRAPGGGIGESYAVMPKPEDMPSFRGAQAAAVEGAKTQVQTEADAVNKGKNADSLISNIDEAERILKARKATGSLIGAGIAAGKGVIGKSDASTQANQQLELISGWMVANVPRMEGPQSNYDVQNYRVMAAMVGDKTKPIDDRLAALRVLRQLQEKYKSIRSGQPTRPPIDSLWGN